MATTTGRNNRSHPAAEWLSVQQAAATYGISADTIRRRIASGGLPASRCGGRLIRVRITDLDQLFRPIPASEPTWGRDAG